MDFSGKKRSHRSKKSAPDFKVVYISSPMRVKTSASKFRSLVQKLTGRDSDAESFMELISAAADVRSNLQSSASTAFLDCQLLGDEDLLIDRRDVAGMIETAAYESPVTPPDDFVLQNFDASIAELCPWLFA